jgi:hypothetical protein
MQTVLREQQNNSASVPPGAFIGEGDLSGCSLFYYMAGVGHVGISRRAGAIFSAFKNVGSVLYFVGRKAN